MDYSQFSKTVTIAIIRQTERLEWTAKIISDLFHLSLKGAAV